MELTYARRSVNLAFASLALAFVALVMAACATPADVKADHDRAIHGYQESLRGADADYQSKLAVAREWDHHVMGIPAVGWVVIFVFVSIFLFALLMFVTYFSADALKDRRANRHALDVEREKTIRSRAERGACTVCGSEPLSAADRKRLGESA